MAAAIRATERGHRVTLFEASRHWGGRARSLVVGAPGQGAVRLDNGQHILIGAYTETLALMERLGVPLGEALHPLPLSLRHPDGSGLHTPAWATRWPAPLDTVAAILTAGGWTWRDRWSLLLALHRWRTAGFACDAGWTVARLCEGLPPRVVAELIAPLCLSALNTPPQRASAAVFLRVLGDAFQGRGHGPYKGPDLLLPRCDLGQLLPDPAVRWLQAQGADLLPATRVQALQRHGVGWRVDGGPAFDHVVLACPAPDAVRLVQPLARDAEATQAWLDRASALAHEAIATVYLQADETLAWPGDAPMLALRSGPGAPAQFVFHRGLLGGPPGVLACVVSATDQARDALERDVRTQVGAAFGLPRLRVLQTVVEKRATFACTPGLQRPGMRIAQALWAAGDHVEGPYPATLEGAVRSGQQAIDAALERD